jgi:hypothetical protein
MNGIKLIKITFPPQEGDLWSLRKRLGVNSEYIHWHGAGISSLGCDGDINAKSTACTPSLANASGHPVSGGGRPRHRFYLPDKTIQSI